MKESYSEIVARYAGPESYADDGNIVGVVTAGVHPGPEIELRKQARSDVPTPSSSWKATSTRSRLARPWLDAAESKTWSMGGNFKHENREIPRVCRRKSPTAVRKLHRR